MLNEQRVKHMVKLAFYESKNGKEDLKISSYYKKDYISLNMWWSIVWLTVAYTIFMVLLGVTFVPELIETIGAVNVMLIGIAVVMVYIILLITYIMISRRFYKKKHARAYHHVKKFKKGLETLATMYEKEDINGETF